MKTLSRCLFVSLWLFISLIEAAKILVVVPTPAISHQAVYRLYTQELVKRGHEVTVVTTDPLFQKGKTPKNLTEIDVHDVSYEMMRMFYVATAGQNEDVFSQIDMFWTCFAYLFHEQLKVDEFRKLIEDKDQKFDLLVVEPVVRSSISLKHIYKVPVIQFSSFGATRELWNIVGAVTHPLLYPTYFQNALYNLTVFEKMKQVYKHYRHHHLIRSKEVIENSLMKEYFGPEISTMTELQNDVDLLFLNIHHIWDDNRPVPPNVIYLGSMQVRDQKELPKDLKNFLDSSKHGVIYISFGSIAKPSLLPPEKIQTINKVFSRLPYDILWKYDLDELPGKSKNVKLVKWVPQSDMLKHPKLKLFITQGGLQSTDEAIHAGVPLIGMPIIVDQWYNTEKYVKHGIGMQIELETFTEKQLFDGINEIINNDRYPRNVLKLRDIYNDHPQTSLERAIWWTEGFRDSIEEVESCE
ncbi:hypothetical protein K1T71_012523 [Dendrolimus kikuchii]|uniref:Uncharacterized protein n=1 Tax=Dendrolimus kikuchii TaxID=765133 RepID=A0ACC1CJS9_9NEOP|nr:hypothetical protein K1T71_012523 [Dendrolimus kikuchii]